MRSQLCTDTSIYLNDHLTLDHSRAGEARLPPGESGAGSIAGATISFDRIDDCFCEKLLSKQNAAFSPRPLQSIDGFVRETVISLDRAPDKH
jgi:hypothetical protein